MHPKTLVISLVGTGCVVAAGLGAYVAVRQGSSTPAAQSVTDVRGPATSAESLGSRVAEAPPKPVPAGKTEADAPSAGIRPSEPRRLAATREAASPAQQTPGGAVGPAAPEPASTISDESNTVAAPPEIVSLPQSSPAAAKPEFDELTVLADSVVGIRLDHTISSVTAKVEDRVTARVTRDVMADGRLAIPSGADLEGNVTMVQRGGKFRERARLGVRFTAIILPDGSRRAIQTETIFRDGDAPGNEASAKIGASAVIGSILGAVIGGKKGAAVGAATGAAGGAAVVAATGGNDAVIASGTPLTVRLTAPLDLLVPVGPNGPRER